MRAPLGIVLIASAAASMACGSPDRGRDPPKTTVQIGVPAGEDGLGFEPLEAGGELRLQTFGQGGTHVLLGVRCVGFGKRAFVTVAMKNLQTGATVRTPAPARPQLLLCREDDITCDLVPFLAMTSGLTEPGEERHGLRIEVSAEVHNEAGQDGAALQEAVLSTADL